MVDGRRGAWAALVAALGTLVCCALPSLLVLLGFGATVAGAVSAAPWLVTLSQNKVWVFAASGALIVGSRLYSDVVSPRLAPVGAACPPTLAWTTRVVWWTSVAVFAVGAFVAFALGPLLFALDR